MKINPAVRKVDCSTVGVGEMALHGEWVDGKVRE